MTWSNAVYVTVKTAFNATATSFDVNKSVAPMNNPPSDGGTLVLTDDFTVGVKSKFEIITYTSTTDNDTYLTINGVTRGAESTTASAWSADDSVSQDATAANLNKLDAIFTERVGRTFGSYETSEPGALILRRGEFSRTTYAALWAKCGPSGTNILGPGNGSTTFNVPDYRGLAIRGTDAGAGRDPDAASRSSMFPGTASGDLAGSVQGDIYEKHNHPMDIVKGDGGHGWPHFQTTDRAHASQAHAGGHSGGKETRMKNAGENFFIYY